MVFHGDYEVDFEIYEKRDGDWRSQLLGHMTGISPEDAKARPCWLRTLLWLRRAYIFLHVY